MERIPKPNPIAMIQCAGTPAAWSSIDIFTTAVRQLLAKVKSMVIDIDLLRCELSSYRDTIPLKSVGN